MSDSAPTNPTEDQPAGHPAGPRINEDQVRHVARLARLHPSAAQVTHFAHQLDAILDYVDKLSGVDVQGVEPMPHAIDQVNIWRDDTPQPGLDVEAALDNAPQRDGVFFATPKVLGDGGGA
ncbi:MAG: Asp-tRNA(Asn)/Glu-tRNA(Gln) amidotransferase subunit GatC [Planctomycetota bacterium]